MDIVGMEPKLENDLFFVCSVIEYIGRATKNRRVDVVRALGEKEIERLVDLADVFHCEPVENTARDLIEKRGIKSGAFDNAGECRYNLPTVFDIAKVYADAEIFVDGRRKILPQALDAVPLVSDMVVYPDKPAVEDIVLVGEFDAAEISFVAQHVFNIRCGVKKYKCFPFLTLKRLNLIF